jgi:hypothetical protein
MRDDDIVISLKREIASLGKDAEPAVVDYTQFDTKLGLPAGSAKRLLKVAAIESHDLGVEWGDTLELHKKRPRFRVVM